MENIEKYKEIALSLEEKLTNNHISTILHLEELSSAESSKKDLPHLLIIVKKFNKYTLMIITNILRQYSDEIAIPFIVEYKDIQGMLDSIPKSFLDIKMNYLVLAGNDVMEMVKPPSYEHFRSQGELTLRTDISVLRRDLIRVMAQRMDSQEYLKEMSIIALNSIRNYYQIIEPKLRTTEEYIKQFNEEFPESKDVLQRILNYAYSMLKGIDITEEDKLQLILSTFDNVLQPILIEIDALGIEFEKTMAKESEKLSYEEFIEKYGEEINRLQDAIDLELQQKAKKSEYILRGELELKFRKREKLVIERYETELQKSKTNYEQQLHKIESTFEVELEKRTSEFIEQKLTEETSRMQNEYEEKLKKMRDDLELKYITTDLRVKEEKLRKEFNEYEKTLRRNYDDREKGLRNDLEIKEKNFRESLELEYKSKLEEQKEKLRKDFDDELDDTLNRTLRKEERRFELDLNRREKALEKTLKKEFTRKEKELQKQFKKQLESKEKELKTKLQLEFEREKLKMESKKSEAFLKLIEKELGLKYKEMDKLQGDIVRAQQLRESYPSIKRSVTNIHGSQSSRNFTHPPKSDESAREKDLFRTILNDNRMLNRGLSKKNVKKVS